jgi:uncharacterized protein YqgV (UPF0045/DUF77 family)
MSRNPRRDAEISVQSAIVTTLRVEFTVEPFSPGDPGPHVTAAVDASRVGPLEPEIGPFATAIEGDVAVIADAVSAVTTAAFAHGATRLSFTLETIPGEAGGLEAKG